MARPAPATDSRPTRSNGLVDIDPVTLLVDLDVRHNDRLDPDFCVSIAEHDVLVPVVAVRMTYGTLWVRHGHRRTQAAVQSGRTTVPWSLSPTKPPMTWLRWSGWSPSGRRTSTPPA